MGAAGGGGVQLLLLRLLRGSKSGGEKLFSPRSPPVRVASAARPDRTRLGGDRGPHCTPRALGGPQELPEKQRCEKGKFQQPVEISPELEVRLSDFSQKTDALMETLRKFKAPLPPKLETKRGDLLGAHRQVHVTLDPETAHPELVLSADGKSVRWGHTRQALPDNPERFDPERCVLGCQGFTSGRHCWEVEVRVQEGGHWAVGVARESVRRKGWINLNPEEGIWAVERGWWGQFRALTSPATRLPLCCVPSRIRVCLDCERGQVAFFDAISEAPIFIFPPGSISGERIRPWLWVWRSWLRLCPPGDPKTSLPSLRCPSLYDCGGLLSSYRLSPCGLCDPAGSLESLDFEATESRE
ncbi:tripartite motif-containing protein 15-like isoform X1 [Gopherus flavomarginatus]|uniref:tripartite motif-containing protein 15-like isoform X1 n=1 Tax=Gopherus flavomarginatus TaxID=286002 RepID=UPI0021CBDB18|nr:tripartite motif-containing protein 15-like isoform X1 [Gopherus flavomarginatus]